MSLDQVIEVTISHDNVTDIDVATLKRAEGNAIWSGNKDDLINALDEWKKKII